MTTKHEIQNNEIPYNLNLEIASFLSDYIGRDLNSKDNFKIVFTTEKWTKMRIRKVKVLEGELKQKAEEMNLQEQDLVIVKDDGSLEKIIGAPVEYLLSR